MPKLKHLAAALLLLPLLLCGQPSVLVSPTSVSFLNVTAGTAVAGQTVIVSSTSPAQQQWFSTTTYSSGSGWLTLSTTNGILQGQAPINVVFGINPTITSTMANGTYSASVIYKLLAGASQTVSVVLCLGNTCGTPPTTTPTSVSLTVGQDTTGTSVLTVNTGLAASWSGTVTTSSGGNWLSISPSSGAIPSSTNVTVNTTGMAVGSYSGSVIITSGGGQVAVGVNLTVVGSHLPSSATFFRMLAYQNNGTFEAALYNFAALSPGGTLTATVPATVTIVCPPGVNGTDAAHYLYISGGVGTAEAVLITGGTCTSAAVNGTITFTPANNHSGAWTITSASGGIQEAYADLPSAGGEINIPSGTITFYATTTFAKVVSLIGPGPEAATITCPAGIDCFRVTTNPFTGVDQTTIFQGFKLGGNSAANSVGIHASGIVGFTLKDFVVSDFTGTGAVGWWMDNGASFSDPAANFSERTQTYKVWLNNNTVGLKFTVQAAATDHSFFYSNFKDMHFNVNAGQTGVLFSGTASSATSPFLFNSLIDWQFNCYNAATMISIVGTATTLEGNTYNILGETTGGAGCVPLANAGFMGGVGQFKADNSAAPTGAGTVVWRAGYYGINANQVIENPNTLSSRVQFGAGSYMIPQLGAPGAFKQCFGLRVHFDGTNWITDVIAGTNNGGAVICEDGTALQFFSIPSTGSSSPQTISTAALAAYERSFIKGTGVFFGPETGGGAPASLMLSEAHAINWGTIAANACVDSSFTLTGAVSTDSYFVTTAAAPPAGIFFNVFGGGASAPVVRACNATTAPVVVNSLTMRVDAWRH